MVINYLKELCKIHLGHDGVDNPFLADLYIGVLNYNLFSPGKGMGICVCSTIIISYS